MTYVTTFENENILRESTFKDTYETSGRHRRKQKKKNWRYQEDT